MTMINLAQVLGRVGRIETNRIQSGLAITNISMVTSKRIVKDGQKEEKVTWHNITLFSKVAEIAEKYVAVGDLLYVRGEMDSKKWTDKNGVERVKTFLVAQDIQLMPKTKEHKAPESKDDPYQSDGDNDVPW